MSTSPQKQPLKPLLLIMAGVLLWGIFHATGAYLAGYDWRKPLVVLGFFIAFLGFWCVMLLTRKKKA